MREGRYLLFSDPNANRIYKYTADGQLSIFREQSGYAGADIGEYGQPGSNGLTLDKEGRLTINQHGNRRVVRVEKDGRLTVLAERDKGKRLNSPNDLVYRMTSAPGEDAIDGIKVDVKGDLYVSGPGGLWALSPSGKHLGTIIGPRHPHNFAWGDEDGNTLYLCARSGLYRMKLNVPGIRP